MPAAALASAPYRSGAASDHHNRSQSRCQDGEELRRRLQGNVRGNTHGPLACNPFTNPCLPPAAAAPVIVLPWAAKKGAAAALATAVPACEMMATPAAAYPAARAIAALGGTERFSRAG